MAFWNSTGATDTGADSLNAQQQQQFLQMLQAQAAGVGPSPAGTMLQQQASQNEAMALGQAAAARGVNPALALRNAQLAAVQANQHAAGAAAIERGREQLAAEGLTGQTLGQARGQDIQKALGYGSLQQGNNQFNAGQDAGVAGGLLNAAGPALGIAGAGLLGLFGGGSGTKSGATTGSTLDNTDFSDVGPQVPAAGTFGGPMGPPKVAQGGLVRMADGGLMTSPDPNFYLPATVVNTLPAAQSPSPQSSPSPYGLPYGQIAPASQPKPMANGGRVKMADGGQPPKPDFMAPTYTPAIQSYMTGAPATPTNNEQDTRVYHQGAAGVYTPGQGGLFNQGPASFISALKGSAASPTSAAPVINTPWSMGGGTAPVTSYGSKGQTVVQPGTGVGASVPLNNGTPVQHVMYATGGPVSFVGRHLAMAKGGKVPALVSPGERYLNAEQAQEVAAGKKQAIKAGEVIPGKAKVPGAVNSYQNDNTPKTLEAGGVVIPRSVTQADDKAKKADAFVKAVLAKGKK